MPRPAAKPAPANALRAIQPADRAAHSGASKKQVPRTAAATDETQLLSTTHRIAESITAAIVERRLMPGTKLAEQKIADIFKVSRTIVRQALHQLSRDKLVTLEQARGARVAQPSVEEARQVRRMLESAMIKRAATELTAQQLGDLRAHLHDEQAAVQRTDVPGRTRLLADFHVVLARMLDNEALADILRELVSRSSLISLMYQSAHSAEHSFAEHVAIVDALEKRDARAAVKLMESHLHNVERNLRLNPRVPDLETVLRPES